MIALAFICLALRVDADDQITKLDGTIIPGSVVGVTGDQVQIQSMSSRGTPVKLPHPLSDIKSVKMDAPAAVAKVMAPGTPDAAAIAALEPQVKLFAGLPTDWVVDAMARLAEAYANTGKAAEALAMYSDIVTRYPKSKYESVAISGKADMSLKAGKYDEALAAVQPIVEAANKNIAPSPAEGATYAHAFLVYGSVLEAQKKPKPALEAFLTVKTMFYQNPALVEEADRRVKSLRDKNPGIGIE